MASKVAKAAKGGIRAWLMPEIIEIKGELKTLSVKVEEMDRRLTGEIQSLKESLNVVQRLAVLEAKQRESEKKSSG